METDKTKRAFLKRAISLLVAGGCCGWECAFANAPEKNINAKKFLTSFLGDEQLFPNKTGVLESTEVETLFQIYRLLLNFHGFTISDQFLIGPDEFSRFLSLKSSRRPSYYSEYKNALRVWTNIKNLLVYPEHKKRDECFAAIHEIRLPKRATIVGSPFYHINEFVLREMLALHITSSGFLDFFDGTSVAKNSYGHVSRWFLHPNRPFRDYMEQCS